MKFRFLLIFLLCSCTNELSKGVIKTTYTSSGFAYIYNELDYVNKITSKKFNNDELLIGHSRLRVGKLIKITNPKNKKSVILKVKKKTKYPKFYQILITESVAYKLELEESLPFVEIQEIKKNKSFIAERAKTFDEEKKVVNKVPVTGVKIDNISKIKKTKKTKSVNFSIIIAEFFSSDSAVFLKERIIKEMPNFNNKKISIRKKKKNNFQLISGPYNTVNSLKNDYIILKKNGFEELDVKLNE
tara:strand:+ start:743 stop:1474 length:732 start_codon:yes stop_codon:yes gene_type:complete